MEIPDWHTEGNRLVREIDCADYSAAVAVIEQIRDIGNELDHFPDVQLRNRNKLTVEIHRHGKELDQLDNKLALRINQLL